LTRNKQLLNWIDKNERKPTAGQMIYRTDGKVVWWGKYSFEFSQAMTHWIPLEEMPLPPKPKRWRVPTIQDLAQAGKPIPCRVRDDVRDPWDGATLMAIDVGDRSHPFWTDGAWYKFCEIEAGQSDAV
jgi:hypothetical protein